MNRLAKTYDNIDKNAQIGSQILPNSGTSLPLPAMAQYAYHDPNFALGNLIGSYLAGVYQSHNTPDTTPQPILQVGMGQGSNPDFQSTLDANAGNKFTLDENGNAVYKTPAFVPAMYSDTTIQAPPQSFKEYINNGLNTVNGSGLFSIDQLSQMAKPAPNVQPTGNTDIPAITGQLGDALNGSLSMSMNGSPFSNGWTYQNPYSPKSSGDTVEQTPVSPSSQKRSAMYTIDDTFPGMIEKGNIDIANRPTVHLADGSIATVRSMGINVDGKEYLIPTVSDDGRLLTKDEAIAEFKKTGKHLGVFDSPEASDRYAVALHNQQDGMYTGKPAEETKNTNTVGISPIAANEPPIKAVEPPIQPAETPIKANTPPLSEDKKEVYDGKNLRIQSAQDGQMYDFTVSNDGKWITFDHAKVPAAMKDKLISAMHNPQQSYLDLTAAFTRPTVPDAASADTTANASAADTAPQPFNAQKQAAEYVRIMRERGFNDNAINADLQVRMPAWQEKEDQYNNYQASALFPLYQAAIRKGDNISAGQLAQQMAQYNPQLSSYMLSGMPTGINYYNTLDANQRAATAEQYKRADIQDERKYKSEEEEKSFNRQVQMKQIEANLQAIARRMDMQDKLAYQRATQEEKIALLRSYGATDEDIRYALGGGGSRSRGGSSASGSAGGQSGGKLTEKQKELGNELNNLYTAAMTPDGNGRLDHDAVDELTEFVNKNANKLDDEDATLFRAKAYIAQGFMQKRDGHEDGAYAMFSKVPRYLLEELVPNMNWDGYD